MLLIAKAIRISHAEFHCNRLTTVLDFQDYVSLIFETQCSYLICDIWYSDCKPGRVDNVPRSRLPVSNVDM